MDRSIRSLTVDLDEKSLSGNVSSHVVSNLGIAGRLARTIAAPDPRMIT